MVVSVMGGESNGRCHVLRSVLCQLSVQLRQLPSLLACTRMDTSFVAGTRKASLTFWTSAAAWLSSRASPPLLLPLGAASAAAAVVAGSAAAALLLGPASNLPKHSVLLQCAWAGRRRGTPRSLACPAAAVACGATAWCPAA